jgi:hypothetical protein
MEENLTKTNMMDSITEERKLLEDQIFSLTEGQMLQPTLEGGCSVKDMMAHITAWEGLMIGWLKTAMLGEIPQILPPGFTWDDLDIWNDRIYSENKEFPLSLVIDNFHASHQIAIKTVEGFSEDDLINPDRYSWRNGKPLLTLVAANTYWHYAEHREQLLQWRAALEE